MKNSIIRRGDLIEFLPVQSEQTIVVYDIEYPKQIGKNAIRRIYIYIYLYN